MPDSRPGLILDREGICNACRWHETKEQIDWQGRHQELLAIAQQAKRDSSGPWDCVLGVSGGKDSTWQAFYLRDELNLNPLLVQYSSAEGTDLGRFNLENLCRHGFSLVSMHPSPKISRKLSRKSFRQFGNIIKYAEQSLFSTPYRVAMAYHIPLVFFGENPALECGDGFRKEGQAVAAGWDATTIRYNNTLGGAALETWLGDGIAERDIIPYSFPSTEELELWGGRGIFMGYYLNWSGYRNALFAMQRGLRGTTHYPHDIGDYCRYNSLDSQFVSVNSHLKYVKLGFGHTTEFSCYDIRSSRLTRTEAARLVREFDGVCDPRFIKGYCDWIGISIEEFQQISDQFRGSMWQRTKEGKWQLKQPLWAMLAGCDDVDVYATLSRISAERLAFSIEELPIRQLDKHEVTSL